MFNFTHKFFCYVTKGFMPLDHTHTHTHTHTKRQRRLWVAPWMFYGSLVPTFNQYL